MLYDYVLVYYTYEVVVCYVLVYYTYEVVCYVIMCWFILLMR